ncbi:class I SAM-dependent methyltransferase [Alphaproteobacteria bacterium]|nr:class I SAM-dependent methyltransferase [Alphaproteobacteria bacterium]
MANQNHRNIYLDGEKKYFLEYLKLLGIKDNLTRLARKNELTDYFSVCRKGSQKIHELHVEIAKIREESTRYYDEYDYGAGYFYQSMTSLGISGFRDTCGRVRDLDLITRLAGKSILDIGSNAGFILCQISKHIRSGLGIEINPFLTRISSVCADYLYLKNVKFHNSSFERYCSRDKRFDAILSLANHSTFDGQTKFNFACYFEKISSLLNGNGQLIFESHPPNLDTPEQLASVMSAMEQYFVIESQKRSSLKGFLDKDRTYLFCRKK